MGKSDVVGKFDMVGKMYYPFISYLLTFVFRRSILKLISYTGDGENRLELRLNVHAHLSAAAFLMVSRFEEKNIPQIIIQVTYQRKRAKRPFSRTSICILK